MGRRATSSSGRDCSAESDSGRARRGRRAAGAAVPLLAHGPQGHRQAARRAQPHEARRADGGRRRRDVARSRPASPTSASSSTTTSRSTRRTSCSARPSRRRALLQARSPSLDLDSLYGAGPQDPESAKFYEADGMHLKMGKTVAADGIPAKNGFDLPRGAGSSQKAKRRAIIPDPRNDENLAVAQTHLAMIRFHNRVLDTPAGLGAGRRSASPRRASSSPSTTSGWSAPTTCRGSAARARSTTSSTRAARCSRSARRRPTCPTMPIEFSRRRLPARPLDDPRRLQLEQDLRRRLRHARAAVHVLGAPAATSAAACSCRATGSPTSAASTTSSEAGRSEPRRAGSQVQPREGDRHPHRRPAAQPAADDVRRLRHPERRPAAATSRSATSRARGWCGSRPASRWPRS